MIAYIFSILPLLFASFCSIVVTWLLCKFWYNAHYVHSQDVRPLQESQYAMQNQYSILAERIKHADQKVLQLTEKLELESAAHQEAVIKIAALEAQLHNMPVVPSLVAETDLKQEIIALLESQQAKSINNNDADKNRLKEMINIMRQSIQEFKTDFNQKATNSTSQQNELSAQVWQLLEINKKLSEETSQLSKALSSFIQSNDKNQDRPFTLTNIQKRS